MGMSAFLGEAGPGASMTEMGGWMEGPEDEARPGCAAAVPGWAGSAKPEEVFGSWPGPVAIFGLDAFHRSQGPPPFQGPVPRPLLQNLLARGLSCGD